MEDGVRERIAELHAGPWRLALATTGGGTGLAAWLLAVPGASRSVLEAVTPYSEDALCRYLGRRPESFCSADTARLLAERALDRARWLAPGQPAAGVACTASLRSDRPKRGEHRFHLAVHTGLHVRIGSLTLVKEARSREQEEDFLDRVFLNFLLESLDFPGRVPAPCLPGEQLARTTEPAPGPLARLLRGEAPAVCVEPDGRCSMSATAPALLLPGSFNPLHDGHLTLADLAGRMTGRAPAFELSVANADKPALHAEEVRRRLQQLTGLGSLWLTHAPTFVEKARLFPGVTFAVGADTAARIVQPRFYGDSPAKMAAALDELRRLGCRFLVAGRTDPAGEFVELSALSIPEAWRDLFVAIPKDHFRVDVSSTELRRRQPACPPAQEE
jgi:hypothetical protein